MRASPRSTKSSHCTTASCSSFTGVAALFAPAALARAKAERTVTSDCVCRHSRAASATWTVNARTTKPTRFVTFPGAELRALCDRDRDLGYCLMRYVFENVAQRLVDARVQLLDLYGRAG